MSDEFNDILARVASALERIAPDLPQESAVLGAVCRWDGHTLQAVPGFAPVSLALLTGIDAQKSAVLENCRRLAQGFAAHDILLWGARGSGKSALVKASVAEVQAQGHALRLVEVSGDKLATLPALFPRLADQGIPTILFLDDLGFDDHGEAARLLRSLLDGGVMARPAHIRLYATSNRRHIVSRIMSEQDSPINPRDVVDDHLALADRFGLSLGFHVCTQDDYLAMVQGYAGHLGIAFDQQDALTWSNQRGARSGRIAWHYVTEIAGRAGKMLK